METTKRKAAIVGGLNVDIGGLPEAAFRPGDSIPGRVRESLGGVGWNLARDCALLGAETAFFSVLGTDGYAPLIRAEAERFGVALDGCAWADAPNNRYLYIRGQRGEMAAAVNDMRLCNQIDEAFIRSRLPSLAGFDVAAADANLPEAALQALADGVSIPLVADAVSAAKCGRLRSILPRIHTVKANRLEAEMLTGRLDPADAARALLDAGARCAVISLGPEGVLCAEGSALLRLPAAAGPVLDVTGAGDSLTAALVYGLARGLPLERRAALGMRAAAATMGALGAVTDKLKSLTEVIA